MIPCLSDNCKKEIQGSFKIVADDRLKELSEQMTEVNLTDDDQWLKNFMSDASSAKESHKSLFEAIKKHKADFTATETDLTGIFTDPDEVDETTEKRDLLVH